MCLYLRCGLVKVLIRLVLAANEVKSTIFVRVFQPFFFELRPFFVNYRFHYL